MEKMNTFLGGVLFTIAAMPLIEEVISTIAQAGQWLRTKIAIATARDYAIAEKEQLELDGEEQPFQMGFACEPAIGYEMPSEEEWYDDDDDCCKKGAKRK